MPSNAEHVDRAVEMVVNTGKKENCATRSELQGGHRRSEGEPQVQLIKRLMAKGWKFKCGMKTYLWGGWLGRIASTSKR